MSNEGLYIFTSINRPPRKLIDAFVGMPSAAIADNMNRMSCMNATIRPINNLPLLGPAFTVKSHPDDNLLLQKALDLAQPGDVLVVDAQGDLTNPVMGKLLALWSKQRGIGGFIIDGAVRDIGALRRMDVPIYAAGTALTMSYKDRPGKINVPVTCGGVVVNPGDILVGDEDGIVVINPRDADDLLIQSKNKIRVEQKIMNDIEKGTLDRMWIEEALKARRAVIINDNRNSPRVNVDAPVTIIIKGSAEPIHATAINMSMDGILLQVEQPLEILSQIRLCLSKELGNINIVANVTWQQYNNFGCEFVDIAEEVRAILDHVIYRHSQFGRLECLDIGY
ncbi:RraA family protein [Pelosinus propionicus]|uniref:Putative 4-hydroxy-4-methyl-2-oxoglutarate aldolase n=1 Tax=Pelosinus propionicus DSM 13327 TaxID=1123291 RepID=A0A1I4LQJ9_9FIRM|nr:PilZ domain-containing protein [Pelosinus propionicus]SFL93229.1 RraA famliy [Pelosinus propionicus DSM 13327]